MPFLWSMLLAPVVLARPIALPPAYDLLCRRVVAAYDTGQGGFVSRKGVLHESSMLLALRLAPRSAAWRERADSTLAWMWGLRDTVGGGYVHTARDADPHDPSFEKRTDSNVRRLTMMIETWRLTGDERHRRESARIADYVDRVLLDGRGGFVAGQVDRTLVPEFNGLAIHAWLEWAMATGDRRILAFAQKSLDRVWQTTATECCGYLRANRFGEIEEAPQLADQTEMGRATTLAAHLGGRPIDRSRAIAIGDMLLERFEDPERRGFRTQAAPSKDGGVRKASRNSAENARAALFLCELTVLTGDPKYRAAAERAWKAFDEDFAKAGLEAADWALAMRVAAGLDDVDAPRWRAQKIAAPSRRVTSYRPR